MSISDIYNLHYYKFTVTAYGKPSTKGSMEEIPLKIYITVGRRAKMNEILS